jgi:thioredoxin 1
MAFMRLWRIFLCLFQRTKLLPIFQFFDRCRPDILQGIDGAQKLVSGSILHSNVNLFFDLCYHRKPRNVCSNAEQDKPLLFGMQHEPSNTPTPPLKSPATKNQLTERRPVMILPKRNPGDAVMHPFLQRKSQGHLSCQRPLSWRKHMIKKFCAASLVALFLLGTTPFPSPVGVVSADQGLPSEIPVKGMVTMVDLGAPFCPPCKAMAPFLEKLERDYKGKAAILVLDVGKHPDLSERFGITEIPTQIFYNTEGKEILRHIGFMSEEAIHAQLKKMGVH